MTEDLRPSLAHPWMGARVSTLLRAWYRNGIVAPQHLGLAAAMLSSAVVRSPFAWLEDAVIAARRRRGPIPADPIFVVGHWRTGTTHLHNLLSRNPDFGIITPLASGLPDQLLTLATWFQAGLEQALPEDRHVDRVAVDPDSPQEDEIPLANQQTVSLFHAVYLPKHFRREFRRGVFFEGCPERDIELWERRMRAFVEKVVLHQQRSTLLIKNPVYTARLRRLHDLWPGARFIHIRRNPYTVFASTRTYYRRLLSELALQPFHHVDLDEFVAETFVDLMERYDRDLPSIPAHQRVEVSFEDLERDPIPTLSGIFEALALPKWRETQPQVEAYLDRIAGYEKNRLTVSAATQRIVDERWKPWVERWGYEPPNEPRTATTP